MTKLMLIVLILFITTDVGYSRNDCACTANWDPVCSTTNETHSNEGCLQCAHQVLACRRECPCVSASANATATAYIKLEQKWKTTNAFPEQRELKPIALSNMSNME